MRRDRVQEGKRYVAVAVVVAGLDEHGKFEGAAAPRRRVGRSGRAAERGQSGDQSSCGGDCDRRSNTAVK